MVLCLPPSFADGMLIPLSLQQPLWGVIIDHNQLVKDTLVSVINGNQVAIQPVYCSQWKSTDLIDLKYLSTDMNGD